MKMTRSTATLAAALGFFAVSAQAGADLSAFDLDGDRFVSFDELRHAVPGATRSDFAALDRNGDRRISANELSGGRAQALVTRRDTGHDGGESLPPRLGSLQVADVDTDGDGRITFDELARADAPALVPLRGN